MFSEILQSYIMHEKHCTKEIQLISEECKILKNQSERYKAELEHRTQAAPDTETPRKSEKPIICETCSKNSLPHLKKLASAPLTIAQGVHAQFSRIYGKRKVTFDATVLYRGK